MPQERNQKNDRQGDLGRQGGQKGGRAEEGPGRMTNKPGQGQGQSQGQGGGQGQGKGENKPPTRTGNQDR